MIIFFKYTSTSSIFNYIIPYFDILCQHYYHKHQTNNYTEAEVMNMIVQATGKNDDEIGKVIGKAKSTIQKYKNTKNPINARPYTFNSLMKICRKYGFEVILQEKK